jgi:hypothetical protein
MDADKLTGVNVRGQRDLKRESKINEAEFIKLFSKKIEVYLDTRGFHSIDELSKYLYKIM